MFFPIGQETRFRLPVEEDEEVVHVAGSRERGLIAVLTPTSIHVYNAQPSVPLCSIRRPESEIAEKGEFVRAYWQFDGAAIAVSTKHCHLLIFSVHFDTAERSYGIGDTDNDAELSRPSRLRITRDGLPSVSMTLTIVVNLAAPVTSAVPLRENLFISGRNGFSHHLYWDGKVDNGYSFQLSKIPFAHDQLQSKSAFLPADSQIYVRDCAYAPLCGGFVLVLSDGRAALLTSNDPKFHPNSLLGVWAGQVRDAVATDTNHRFRILIFGCANGDVCAYNLDEATGALVQTFRVPLRIRNGPELTNRLGAVREVRVLPQNGAIAVVWETANGGGKRQNGIDGEKSSPSSSSTSTLPLPPCAALFSPLGNQLWSSLEGHDDDHNNTVASYSTTITDETVKKGERRSPSYRSIEWGPEGYQIWMGGSHGLSKLDVARSAAFNNPYMEHSERVVLIGSQRLYISPLRTREPEASAPHSVWTTVELRTDYIHANWPIRFASLDRDEGRTLVVAGTSGLSFCSLANQRWKIFGNESQERDLHVTGGLFVWRGLMVGAATEGAVKMYPIETRLDERFATTLATDARVIMCNMKGDILVTVDVDSRLLMYSLTRIDTPGERDGFPRAHIEKTTEIRVVDFIPHVACLVSVQLTVLSYDSMAAYFIPGVDTVLLNVSGRLITLSPKFTAREEEDGEDDRGGEGKYQLSTPYPIAMFVEQCWHDRAIRVDRPRSEEEENGEEDEGFDARDKDASNPLRNALWINCGARGSHVWLALFPGYGGGVSRGRAGSSLRPIASSHHTGHLGGGGGHHSNASSSLVEPFMSKRIMVPFDLEIVPMLISSADCVAIGVEASPTSYGGGALVLQTLHRNSEVFIHHLLRQLLKRNLGKFALDLAGSFRCLPYFTHSLELLLHGVLEEEATSSEPIPDPLLPRAIAFIQEFPEFLRTVAHCARKTELALWPALFEVTGAPNDLFEVCLRDGQLETAASYLIILQNCESAAISLEQSTQLLREALSSCSWPLARDLVRFARSIDAEDMELPARSPPPSGAGGGSAAGRRQSKSTATSHPPAKGAADEFVLARFQAAGKVSRMRHSHSVSEAPGGGPGTKEQMAASRKDSASSGKKVSKAQSSDLSPSSPPSPTGQASNPMLERMQRILHEHAARLLEEYCVRDLGCLCAHLEIDAPSLLSSLPVAALPASSPPPAGAGSTVSSSPLYASPLRIADFPLALQRVHSQFEWPYPVASSRVVDQLAKRFAGIRSSTSAVCLSDVAGSSSTETPTTPSSSGVGKALSGLSSSRVSRDDSTDETATEVVAMMERIEARKAGENDNASLARSHSPSASSMRTRNGGPPDDVSINGGAAPAAATTPLLGPNETVRGNQTREAQLRHMIGVFAEVAAMDWVLVLCVVLKDPATARASLSVASGRRAGPAAMRRVLDGATQMRTWAQANCLGYVSMLSVFEQHVGMVAAAVDHEEAVAASSAASLPARPPSGGTTTSSQGGGGHATNGATRTSVPYPASAVPPPSSQLSVSVGEATTAVVSPKEGRNRGALRAAFVSPAAPTPGGAVRKTRRERSRSVDRGRMGQDEAVSNVTPESSECVIS